MRFIFNFFFFGILFYLIWMFFPDAFTTLVGWANHVVAFLRELLVSVWDKFQHATPPAPAPAHPVTPAAAFLLSFLTQLAGK